MEFIGRIVKVLQERSGVSAKTGNTWRSVSFLFEYFEPDNQRFADRVILDTMDDNIINMLKNEELLKVMNAQSCVRINFYHKTREYNGNMYNDIRIAKFDFLAARGTEQPVIQATAQNAPQAKIEGKTEAPASNGTTAEQDDDLPF